MPQELSLSVDTMASTASGRAQFSAMTRTIAHNALIDHRIPTSSMFIHAMTTTRHVPTTTSNVREIMAATHVTTAMITRSPSRDERHGYHYGRGHTRCPRQYEAPFQRRHSPSYDSYRPGHYREEFDARPPHKTTRDRCELGRARGDEPRIDRPHGIGVNAVTRREPPCPAQDTTTPHERPQHERGPARSND